MCLHTTLSNLAKTIGYKTFFVKSIDVYVKQE